MRYVHFCSSHGVGMPELRKAAAVEILANQADVQFAKGRRKPVTTNVAKYVGRKAPALARALRKVLQAQAKRIAAKVATLYAAQFEKDDASRITRILRILEQLNSAEVGVDLWGELEGPMLAAFRRAASIGATQVGIAMDDDITNQVDEAAVEWAATHGGELIKDLAGTTEEAMRSLLERAAEDGMSADMLADEIMEMGAFGEARAEMIARTELARAHVQGNVEGWRQSGEVEGKRWILADTHPEADECDEAADAGAVGLDEPFTDGIDYPPAHPMCLCDIAPVLRDAKDRADDEPEPADDSEPESP